MGEFEVWLVIDSEGDYAVGADQRQANDAYDTDIGERERRVLRLVRVPIQANLPAIVELDAVTVPDDE